MIKITCTNRKGQSVVITENRPYFLKSIEGLGDLEADNQLQQAPYQDGSVYVDTLLNERVIHMSLIITAHTEKDLINHRQKLSTVFNPKLGELQIKYEDGYQTKVIKGIPDSVPVFPSSDGDRMPTFQKASISITCPDPYWKDPQEVTRALKAYDGKFTFPFEFPVEFGIESDSTIIYNKGDTDAPITISIKGPIRRPIVENVTTGEFIQLNTNINNDEILWIDTSPRHKRVEIFHGNQIIKAMGYLDHNSDFWQLVPGENEIRYRADAGIAEAIASVSWKNQYVGI